MRGLRGRIEELQNENVKLRKEQRDLYTDLDKRLTEARRLRQQRLRAAAARPRSPTAQTNRRSTPRALEELKVRNYAAAVETLRSLAVVYPNGALADNTQYWLGEAYYVTQEYDHATAAFQRVTTNWPNSRKVAGCIAEARLYTGRTEQAAGGPGHSAAGGGEVS